MKGTVLWVNDYKGYGEIERVDGACFYFSLSDLKIDPLKIKKGSSVKFSLGEYQMFGCSVATKVVLAESKKRKAPLRDPEVTA